MIDEKKLIEIEKYLLGDWECAQYAEELIKLARLGLWAREYGIPELKYSLRSIHEELCLSHSVKECLESSPALKALPKDEI